MCEIVEMCVCHVRPVYRQRAECRTGVCRPSHHPPQPVQSADIPLQGDIVWTVLVVIHQAIRRVNSGRTTQRCAASTGAGHHDVRMRYGRVQGDCMLCHARVRFIVGISLVVAGSPHTLRAAPGDTTADAVLGQVDFASGSPNAGGTPTATSLDQPRGLCVDHTSGRLFVPDSVNNRVLSWPSAAAFTNGQAADLVLGQPNFTSNSINQGGANPTDKTLNAPKSVATDSAGRLYVADSLNF